MKAVFSFARFFRTAAVSSRFHMAAGVLALILALGFSGISNNARADVLAGPTTQAPVVGRSVTHGHVFRFTPQGPVDVTEYIYVYVNQTYLMDDAGYSPIFIDYYYGMVFDGSGTVVGFVDLS